MFPAGHTFGSNYSNLNGGYIRFGGTPSYGPTDIGVGFFSYTGGYEVPALGYAGHNTNNDCQYSGGACYGTDVGYLFNGAITFNGLFPIPPQSIGCSTAGAGTSQNYNVRVFPYDSAGNQVGMDLSGQGNCYLWTAFSGSNTGTLTWPAVARAVSYDVVLMNPAHSTNQGWLAGNTSSTSLTLTSGPGSYSYSFPSFTAGARTTINGASLTVNAPTTFNSTLTGTLTGHASLDFPIAGGTLTGLLTTLGSVSGGAGLNCPQGTAPASPNNGDLWCTSVGMYGRFNGSTVGPFGSGSGGGTWAGLSNSSPGNLAIPLGAYTSTFTGGDFGASPIAGLFQYLTSSTTSTDITPLMAWDTGTSYEQGPIARVNAFPAFSVCNAYLSSAHTGFSIFGNATGVSTPPCTNGVLSFATVSKVSILTGSAAHQNLLLFQQNASATAWMLDLANVSTTGFGFARGRSGASADSTGGTTLWTIGSDGTIQTNAKVCSGGACITYTSGTSTSAVGQEGTAP